MRNILRLLIGCVAVVSCGSSDGGSGGGSTCAQIGSAICAKACSCRDGAACGISQDGLTSDFPSESDCLGFLVTLGCSMGDAKAYNDAAACLPLAQAATCASTGAEGAVMFPDAMACQTPQ
jgi:hypothetical protein